MGKMYVATLSSGARKLFNLRRITSVELYKNTIKLYYGFSKVDGTTIFGSGSIEGIQAHELISWSTEKIATEEFKKIQASMEELQ